MSKPKLSPDQALDEAVILLRSGPGAPTEAEIRSWIQDDVEEAKKAEMSYLLGLEHRVAIESLKKSAKATLLWLGVLRELAPWVVDQHTGERHLMYNVLPVEDPQRLEAELSSLATMGENFNDESYRGARPWTIKRGPLAGRKVHLHLPAKKSTKPRLPDHILHLHQMALKRLEMCGMTPSIGTGSNVATLGALLCTASGFMLTFGESTRAARLAKYDVERFLYTIGDHSIIRKPKEKGATRPQTRPPYEPMWTACEIMFNFEND